MSVWYSNSVWNATMPYSNSRIVASVLIREGPSRETRSSAFLEKFFHAIDAVLNRVVCHVDNVVQQKLKRESHKKSGLLSVVVHAWQIPLGQHRSSSHLLKLDTFTISLLAHKNSRNMLRHIVLVMPETFGIIEVEGGKEMDVDWTMVCVLPSPFNLLHKRILLMSATAAIHVDPMDLDEHPGYRAIDVQTRSDGLTAYLVLAGKPSFVFRDDIEKLLLNVDYETCKLVHKKSCVLLTHLAHLKVTGFIWRSLTHHLLVMKFQS
jgi:hypothetical protein